MVETHSIALKLRELGALLAAMTDEQYTRSPVGVFACSMGAQVRHVLDHVDAFVRAVDGGRVDYDHRERGTDVETARTAAIRETDHLLDALDGLDPASFGQPRTLSVLLDHRAEPVEVETSVGRELAFVLSHTIHHQAMIAAMARTMDVPVPDRFGFAPATVAHLERGT